MTSISSSNATVSSSQSTRSSFPQETIFPKSPLPEDICLQILEEYLQEDYRSLNKAFYKRQNAMWDEVIKLIPNQESHFTMHRLIKKGKIRSLFQFKTHLLEEARRLEITESIHYQKVKDNPEFHPIHLKKLDAYIENQNLSRTIKAVISSLREMSFLVPSNISDAEFVEMINEMNYETIRFIVNLKLSGCNITRVPHFIRKFTDLMRLDLSKNKLTELPEFMGQFKDLTQLQLEFNQLTDLPESLSNLKDIGILYLQGNRFKYFPKVVCELSILEELNFSDNQITRIPESIGKLRWLDTISFHNNKLTTIPCSLKGIGLKCIHLRGNPLKNLPNVFNTLKKIQHDLRIPRVSTTPPLIKMEEEKQVKKISQQTSRALSLKPGLKKQKK